jgi:hypothetical protein
MPLANSFSPTSGFLKMPVLVTVYCLASLCPQPLSYIPVNDWSVMIFLLFLICWHSLSTTLNAVLRYVFVVYPSIYLSVVCTAAFCLTQVENLDSILMWCHLHVHMMEECALEMHRLPCRWVHLQMCILLEVRLSNIEQILNKGSLHGCPLGTCVSLLFTYNKATTTKNVMRHINWYYVVCLQYWSFAPIVMHEWLTQHRGMLQMQKTLSVSLILYLSTGQVQTFF